MKKLIFFLPIIACILFSCDNDDNTNPQPTNLKFNLETATYNGNTMEPKPNYQLTLSFTVEGTPDTYSVEGDAAITPSISNTGTWTMSGNILTFNNLNESREVSISSGAINNESANFSLSWELDKTQISLDQVGEYTYNFTLLE